MSTTPKRGPRKSPPDRVVTQAVMALAMANELSRRNEMVGLLDKVIAGLSFTGREASDD